MEKPGLMDRDDLVVSRKNLLQLRADLFFYFFGAKLSKTEAIGFDLW